MDLSDEDVRSLSHSELLIQFFQMREEYNEFQTSSSEIEKILDSELEEVKHQLKRAETRVQQLSLENERTKGRQDESRAQWVQVEEQLRKENAMLREQCERQRQTVRKLEQRNDVLETSERNKEFLASDLGSKLDSAIEKIAMLENELYEKQVAAEEMYRLREEWRTTERPRLIVEPLRNETQETPDEPSPGTSKENIAIMQAVDEDVCMEDVEPEKIEIDEHMEQTVTRIDDIHIDDNKNLSVVKDDKSRRTSTGTGTVNRIVKDLMSKVERLESLLSTIRVSNNSNKNGNHLTTTRA